MYMHIDLHAYAWQSMSQNFGYTHRQKSLISLTFLVYLDGRECLATGQFSEGKLCVPIMCDPYRPPKNAYVYPDTSVMAGQRVSVRIYSLCCMCVCVCVCPDISIM